MQADAPRRGRAPRRHHLGRRRLEPASARSGRSTPSARSTSCWRSPSTRRTARLLVASSAEVYGRIADDEDPLDEDARDRADLALRPLEGRGGDRLRARRSRRRRRAAVPAHGPGQSETLRDPVVRRADRAHRGRPDAPPTIKVGNLAARRDYSDVRCVVDAYAPTARSARRAARLQRRHRSGAQHAASCSTGCSPSRRWRSRSRSTRLACGRPTFRCSSGRRGCSRRRRVGGQPGRSTKPSRTCSTPREMEWVRSERQPRPTRADHRHHRAGRLVPRRAPARQRATRCSASCAARAPSRSSASRTSRAASSCCRPICSTRPRCRRRCATARPHEVYNLAAQSFVPTSWSQPVLTAEFTAVGVTRMLEAIRHVDPSIRFYQASSSEMFGKVREVPQNEDDAVLPAQPVRRREGLRALHHGELPRELRPLRGLGHPLQPRVAAPRARVRDAQDLRRRRAHQARPGAASCASATSTRSATGASRATTCARCG